MCTPSHTQVHFARLKKGALLLTSKRHHMYAAAARFVLPLSLLAYTVLFSSSYSYSFRLACFEIYLVLIG